MKSAAASARATIRVTRKALGLATGGVEWAMGVLPLDIARARSRLDGGRPLVCDEALQIGPGSAPDSRAEERCPAQEPAARSEGLARPMSEVERVGVVDDH